MALNTNNSPRIAIFGGSFDPIHLGHLHIAQQVLDMEAAKEVWFIPSGKHRFKQDTILLDYPNRYSLIQKAIQNNRQFKLLDLDNTGMGDGSTYELMQKLIAQYPAQQFTYLIGMDNLAQLPAWVNFTWLKQNLRFLIAVRPGYSADASITSQLEHFNYLNCKPMEISSTSIRQKLISGQGIQGMVPPQLLVEITRLYKGILR
jgi:nicotinate-nucleotide adenylyltransferase